jgi:hypothetical protein
VAVGVLQRGQGTIHRLGAVHAAARGVRYRS